MNIRVEDAEKTDLSQEATEELIPLSTPGQILREEFMLPLELSANALATALKVPANRITSIIKGNRSITADTALRLGRYFGTTAEFWVNLQKNYELRLARRELSTRIEREVRPRAA